jgi:hypothetical protein
MLSSDKNIARYLHISPQISLLSHGVGLRRHRRTGLLEAAQQLPQAQNHLLCGPPSFSK